MDSCSAIANKIQREQRKIQALDERIGRLMSNRVSIEEKIAALHEEFMRATKS